MKYQNKKNNRVAEVIEQDDKCKTVLLQYEDGTDTKITFSTLHRWWKALPEEADQVPETIPIEEQVKEVASKILSEEDKASDGTSYKEVMQDIIHDKKVTAKKEKKQVVKKEAKPKVKKEVVTVNEAPVIEYIDTVAKKYSLEKYVRDRQPGLANYKVADGPVLFCTIGQKRALWLMAKSRQLNDTLNNQAITAGGFYDKKFNISELTNENKKLIDNVIKTIVINSDKKKEEK